MIGVFLAAIDKISIHLGSNMLWAAVFIVSAYITLYAGYGAYGIAASLLFAYTIKMVVLLLIAKKILLKLERQNDEFLNHENK